MLKEWYILIAEKQEGPYSIADLRKDSRITPDTMVWKQGFEKWLPMRDVPELKNLFEDAAEDKDNVPPAPLILDDGTLTLRSEPPIFIFGSSLQLFQLLMLSTSFLHSGIKELEGDLSAFLREHYDPARPLLLALSGGPDSLALLHLLLEYRKSHSLALGLAHVDHGWRPESGEEARLLQQMARALELPFHIKRLNPKEIQGNLEAACREERLKFFGELCRLHNYQATLLAHHADDQTETVLKRVLEGVSLPHLSSMQPVAQVRGVTLWRPLLHVKRQEILTWLETRGLKGFEDETNLDPKFLRGRFRTRLLPLLTAEFGKEVGVSLERLGAEAVELRDYLDLQVSSSLSRIEKSRSGLFLDLNQDLSSHPYELRHLIRKFCEYGALNLSREGLETALKLVLSCAADKQVACLKVDRGRLFIPTQVWPPIQERIPLQLGEMSIAGWSVVVKEMTNCPEVRVSMGWKEVWRGRVETWIPVVDGFEVRYELGSVELQAPYYGQTTISKWWTNAKVPAFLRHTVPVIWRGTDIFHEFLTGRERKAIVFVKKWLHVVLER